MTACCMSRGMLAAVCCLLVGCSSPEVSTPPPSSSAAVIGSTSPSPAAPSVTEAVPPAPPSSAFTWPSPQSRTPQRQDGRPRGLDVALERVNRSDIDAVAAAYARTSYTLDAQTDTSPNAGTQRARVLASPRLRSATQDLPETRGDAAWDALVAAGGYTTVSVQPNADDGRPGDSATEGYRSYRVTVRHTPGGETRSFVLYLKLLRDGAAWSVDEMRSA